MKHIFFIDPVEKLNLKKDSTLMMALTFQRKGYECYLLFEKDFYVDTKKETPLFVYEFSGKFQDEGFYLTDFKVGDKKAIALDPKIKMYMRIDPPYDSRYQRYLWMLDYLIHSHGIQIENHPIGIMKHNEKLLAYKQETTYRSFVGSSLEGFNLFVKDLASRGETEMILKPLDLYSGIGVEKVSLKDPMLVTLFKQKVTQFGGAIIAQPFIKQVYQGEFRSLYYRGKELGTIIKLPQKGEFISNIAQGAKFQRAQLSEVAKQICRKICQGLADDGVQFVAFDILGDVVTEVNVTCPGLLVEVSTAMERNLCEDLL